MSLWEDVRTQVCLFVATLLGNAQGQGTAEYGLILALIAIVCVAGFTSLGKGVLDQISNVTSAL